MADYLFAHPSFAEGVGRIFDFGGTLTMFNTSSTPREADRIALGEDWRAVGADLRAAVARVKREATQES